ncbi:MAG: hypothetical protein P0Y53_00080 [Candidatus Pseudobacter hemicellulosilyticus]|uniref:Uncharacterized protein n=1 Tax=Candidatus Pseudobacter hemicellulosilyticus TaxID=3121375 RepID=A0AAJ5WWZ5_9BACT|nr:MAG: hypothetical protein P0Y53_00080 [Pseudobacter sp.]
MKGIDLNILKQRIQDIVFKHFVDSRDYNGIPLRDISDTLEINYAHSIEYMIAFE